MAQENPPTYEISRSDLKIFTDKLIGVGSYGEVYEGRCRGQDVAVKLLKSNSPEDVASFQREIDIMSHMRHPHIVLFMGAITVSDQLQIVMELLESGLDEVLQSPHRQLTLLQCFQIAFECASGINWLHCMKPYPIIHRDIRCPNFLIDESLRVKVCDFGLSLWKTEDTIHLPLPEEIHSPAYLAPEIFKGNGFDEKCDVYSYGITLWEILTRHEAYSDQVQSYPHPRALLEAVCDPRDPLRPSLQILSSEIPCQLRQLMISCWDADLNQRPQFADILEELRETIDSFAILAPSAREFWEENFGKKTKVLWSHFQAPFVQHLRIPALKASLCACIQYLVSRGTDEVTMSHFGALMDYFGPLNKRHGDNHFYHAISQTVKQSWFFGNMGPTEAAARLLDAPVGSFLVRFSSSIRGNFVITVKLETEIVHLPIQHAPLGSSFQIDDRVYPSLETLIDQETERFHLNYPCPGSIFSLLMSSRHDTLSLSFSCSNILKHTPSPARKVKIKKTVDLT